MSVSKLRRISDFIICILICFVAIMGFSAKSVVTINTTADYKVLYNGDRSNQRVGLCFGVYDGGENVKKILSCLALRGAHATFFVGGCWADDNADILHDIANSGSEIGNFGYFNTDLKSASAKAVKDEIALCHEIVKALSGYTMKVFCPPSFSFSQNTVSVAEKLGYKTVICKKNVVECESDTTVTLFKRVTDNLSCGDFVMLYPTDGIVSVLDRIITYCENAGLKVSTISQCL